MPAGKKKIYNVGRSQVSSTRKKEKKKKQSNRALTGDVHDGDGDDEAGESEDEERNHLQEDLLVMGAVAPRHLGFVAAAGRRGR